MHATKLRIRGKCASKLFLKSDRVKKSLIKYTTSPSPADSQKRRITLTLSVLNSGSSYLVATTQVFLAITVKKGAFKDATGLLR